jgi:DNA (cytosine-5)-methyltransferase 1
MSTLGELCAGGGMLTRALEEMFGVTSLWHAENDPAASAVLARHWPGVPNLGDVTAIGGPYGVPRRHLDAPRRTRRDRRVLARRLRAWRANVPAVKLLAAGFPCTPFSLAGERAGSADERHLWPDGVAPGIEALMPPVVVLENVPNLLRIESGGVFGQVLTSLDRLGYTVAWTTVGACKMGACHHRHRLFVLAVRDSGVAVPGTGPVAARRGEVWLPVQQVLFGDVDAVKWPASGVSRHGSVWPLPADTCGDTGVVLLPSPRSSDARRGTEQLTGLRTGRGHGGTLPDALASLSMFPTPTARDATRGAGRKFAEGRPLSEVVALLPDEVSAHESRFGNYEAAVRRHEMVFGFPVPAPTEPGRVGKPRMAAPFPEWMMGLPRGYLTDVVPRSAAIRIAGNGVFGPAVVHGLSSLPTFPTAVRLLASARLEVAA